MPGNFYSLKNSEKGQSLVEFALILPILILLILGIIQFGIIFGGYITVSSAAREGARLASVREEELVIKEKVIDIAATYGFLEPVTYDNINISENISSLPVSVEVTSSVQIIVPIAKHILGSQESFPVSARVVMRSE